MARHPLARREFRVRSTVIGCDGAERHAAWAGPGVDSLDEAVRQMRETIRLGCYSVGDEPPRDMRFRLALVDREGGVAEESKLLVEWAPPGRAYEPVARTSCEMCLVDWQHEDPGPEPPMATRVSQLPWHRVHGGKTCRHVVLCDECYRDDCLDDDDHGGATAIAAATRCPACRAARKPEDERERLRRQLWR